ncbi:MAG TPA: hypothetical protein VKO41_04465 [Gaiellaceae bacterium]|nr:hypothetical protein [Gaiellaceae bacterium]
MAVRERSLFTALVGVGLLIVALAAVIAWWAWDSDPQPALDRPLVASATLTPQQHLFADAVHARVEVVLDRGAVDPDSIQIHSNFAPYRALQKRKVSRNDVGRMTRLRYDYTLACMTAKCLPKKTGRVDFGLATVEYQSRDSSTPQSATIDWQPLRVAGRIAPGRLWQGLLRAEYRDLPAATYRIGPGWVEFVALVLAALFALGALILILRLLPLERLATRLWGVIDRRSALERALALVRESSKSGRAEDGRKALERLSVELKRSSNPDLAQDASRIAWSQGSPGEAVVSPLSTEVERVISEGT